MTRTNTRPTPALVAARAKEAFWANSSASRRWAVLHHRADILSKGIPNREATTKGRHSRGMDMLHSKGIMASKVCVLRNRVWVPVVLLRLVLVVD
jgi:hypothetical protein